MDWTRPIGVLAVLVVVAIVIGGLITLFARLLTSVYAISAILVLLLLVACVAGMIRSGVVSGRFLSNPYW